MVFTKLISIILGIFLVITGMQLAAYPASTAATLPVLLGISIFVFGIVGLVTWFTKRKFEFCSKWTLIGDILSIAVGIFLLVSEAARLAIDVMLPYLMGASILVEGVISIARAIQLSKLLSAEHAMPWVLQLVLGIIMVTVGILVLTEPLTGFVALGTILAIEIMVAGMRTIFVGCFL